ncbi:MAG: hypothetical protein AB7I42_24015 [Bradyrhizobium sp.]|uniref:hypothetical protein n=1 Tax=Bradyrhizobium sp. TaxID=376 RepID=UPI003D0D78DE
MTDPFADLLKRRQWQPGPTPIGPLVDALVRDAAGAIRIGDRIRAGLADVVENASSLGMVVLTDAVLVIGTPKQVETLRRAKAAMRKAAKGCGNVILRERRCG